MTDCRAHVRLKESDTTPAVPFGAVTPRQLAEFRACSAGFGAMCEQAKGRAPSLYDFIRGVEVAQEQVRAWERRSAVEDVL